MLRRALIALALPLVLLQAGCGNSRTQPPNTSGAAAPRGTMRVSFPASGFSLNVPTNWQVSDGQAPLIVTAFSGRALVAVWRYRRNRPLPSSAASLLAAQARLVAAGRTRDASLQVIRSRLLTVDGQRAIELDAIEQIAGQARRVRSLHVYAFGGELVLDEYAPPGAFHAVDHQVFSPVKRSLRVFAAGAA